MAKDEVEIRSKFMQMIMMPEAKERMKLPTDYSDKLKQEKSKRAILKTPKGRWEMDVRRDDDDGEIFFEDGWPRFAQDHALGELHFLVFDHTGNLHFNVFVCDKTMCEKQCLVECRNEKQNQDHHAKNKGKAEKKPVVSLYSQRPYFTKKIRPYTATKTAMVNIPLEIVRSNNLTTKEDVILRDPSRKTWPLNLLVQKDVSGVRVLMKNGWHDFYVANKLKVGDLCLFQLNPTSSSTPTTIFFDVQISRC